MEQQYVETIQGGKEDKGERNKSAEKVWKLRKDGYLCNPA
jgi:hypothetical protein